MRIRSLRAVGAAIVVAGSLTLSGCAVFSPVQTDEYAQVGDGVPVTLGDVIVNNLVVVAEKKGGPGRLAGNVVNTTDAEVGVSFVEKGSGASARVTVPARGATAISAKDLTLANVSAGPGQLVTVTVTTANSGSVEAVVPVVWGQPYYADLTVAPTAN